MPRGRLHLRFLRCLHGYGLTLILLSSQLCAFAWSLAQIRGGTDVDVGSALTSEVKVFLCRHGETDWNVQGRLQGSANRPLNAAGKRQAKELAQAVLAGSPRGVAAVVSSPLRRARATGAAIAKAAGVTLHYEPLLRERNLGIMEGRTGKEMVSEHPAIWAAWTSSAPLPPSAKAEAEDVVAARLRRALEELFRRHHGGGAVVVVTHGAAIKCLLGRSVGNGSITTLLLRMRTEASGQQSLSWRVLRLGDDSHLSQEGLKVSGM